MIAVCMSNDTCCRAGFYAENLLAYAPQAKEEGYIPLPIGREHKFPPVALGVSLALSAQ